MSVSAGARLGPYEIQSLIGAGGMGEVYEARETRLDRSVALKVLRRDVSADPERRARFEREAKTVASLEINRARWIPAVYAGSALTMASAINPAL